MTDHLVRPAQIGTCGHYRGMAGTGLMGATILVARSMMPSDGLLAADALELS